MIDIGLTDDERRRATPLALHVARAFGHARRRRTQVPDHVLEQRDNLRIFLARFPGLRYDPGPVSYHRLKGGRARHDGDESLPGADHTFFWRAKGLPGPIVATTFPHRWDDHTHAAAWRFALAHDLRLEVRPSDVPDLWLPGKTTPVVWSRGGVDWRRAVATERRTHRSGAWQWVLSARRGRG
jgi:hypothetical protein